MTIVKQRISKPRKGRRHTYGPPAPLAFNAFELTFDGRLAVPVTLYEVTPQKPGNDGNATSAVDAIWKHRRAHLEYCDGSGFVLGITDDVVAVSPNWDLPSGSTAGFLISRKMRVVASPDGNNRQLVLAILRNAIKNHFRHAQPGPLGVLWRDYGDYCQMPPDDLDASQVFCRKFNVRPKFLADGRLVVQIGISTITLDGWPLASYYQRGKVERVAEIVASARERYSTRKGDPAKFRMWYDLRGCGRTDAIVVEVLDPEQLIQHADLSPTEQRSLADSSIACVEFPDKEHSARLADLRLIAGNSSTREQHRNTILSPVERASIREQVVETLDRFAVHDCVALVSKAPVRASSYRTLNILPPSIQVPNDWDQPRIIAGPDNFSADAIRRRTRERSIAVRRNGFLRPSPLKPLLAWPREVIESRRARRTINQDVVEAMRVMLNARFDERKIDACFESYTYSNVDDLRQYVESRGFDALFAVLPEPSERSYQQDDVHELIKQRIGVPSQCIHYGHTLCERVAVKSEEHLTDRESELVRKAVQQYDLCTDNLLVKCGWLPFISAESFRFNVHVGIDVGGKNNDTVVVSVCHGLTDPNGEIVFRVQRVRVDVEQPEPIPSASLARGIRELFDYIRSELDRAGLSANFEDVLFFRDGAMLGRKDKWNEKDGLVQLSSSLQTDNLIDRSGVWAVAESHKRGELWRVEGIRDSRHENPVVGQCVIGFERPDDALVCTTGQPYLTQGTAKPTIVRVHSVHGDIDIDSVLADYVWEADMGFTKTDMAHSLPWILRIADSGAHQLARAYKLSGITA